MEECFEIQFIDPTNMYTEFTFHTCIEHKEGTMQHHNSSHRGNTLNESYIHHSQRWSTLSIVQIVSYLPRNPPSRASKEHHNRRNILNLCQLSIHTRTLMIRN